MMRALTIRYMILSFSIDILLESCKYWKQLQKAFFLLWKTIVRTLHPLSKYHELPFKVPFKFPLPLHKVKIECMYIVLLKFMFSKKATQLYKIFTVYLIFTTWCQIIVKISSIFVAFLEKINFTQQALMNGLYCFFQGEEYFAHRLWKIVAALSLSVEFYSRREQPFTRCRKD
jgi:hypothetical protein